MSEELDNLNNAILNFLKGEDFLTRLKLFINREKNEMFPDDRYWLQLANEAIDQDPIHTMAEVLVNIEKPTVYVLVSCLERYIEVDSRAAAIREELDRLVDLAK